MKSFFFTFFLIILVSQINAGQVTGYFTLNNIEPEIQEVKFENNFMIFTVFDENGIHELKDINIYFNNRLVRPSQLNAKETQATYIYEFKEIPKNLKISVSDDEYTTIQEINPKINTEPTGFFYKSAYKTNNFLLKIKFLIISIF